MYVLHMYACIFLCLQRHGLYLQPITKNCSGMVSAYEVLLHACTSLYGDMYVCILRRLCSFEEGTVMHYIFPRYCHASCSWMMYCLKTFWDVMCARVYRYQPMVYITFVMWTQWYGMAADLVSFEKIKLHATARSKLNSCSAFIGYSKYIISYVLLLQNRTWKFPFIRLLQTTLFTKSFAVKLALYDDNVDVQLAHSLFFLNLLGFVPLHDQFLKDPVFSATLHKYHTCSFVSLSMMHKLEMYLVSFHGVSSSRESLLRAAHILRSPFFEGTHPSEYPHQMEILIQVLWCDVEF